ncbi:MAG: GIY-YIG nuclease family protein [Planctomycetota bacterium]
MSSPADEDPESPPEAGPWWVYLVRRSDNAIYTGIATDVERRFTEHREGRGAKALRGRGPLVLLASSAAGDRSRAQRVETRIKRLSKPAKERLALNNELLAAFIEAIDDGRGNG